VLVIVYLDYWFVAEMLLVVRFDPIKEMIDRNTQNEASQSYNLCFQDGLTQLELGVLHIYRIAELNTDQV